VVLVFLVTAPGNFLASFVERSFSVKPSVQPSPTPPSRSINLSVQPSPTETSSNSVDFLFATDRARLNTSPRDNFDFKRSDSLTFGVARVHIPKDHKIGKIELPGLTLLHVPIVERDADPDKHFIILSLGVVELGSWKGQLCRARRSV
jgi:hypothetical protein